MKREYFTTALFLLIAGLFFYLFYRLMVPFVTPIAWAGILSIVFYPVYKWVRGKVRSANLASLICCVLIFLIIIGPAIYVLATLVDEAGAAVQRLNEAYQDGSLRKILSLDIPIINSIRAKLAEIPQLAELDFRSIIRDALGTVTRAIGQQATTVIANITVTLFNFFVMYFSLFFFFRDGDRMVAFMKRITPIDRDKVEQVYLHLKSVIEGMMYGGVVMALIQGTLGGILFALFGINSPVLWGTVMAILSFIPVLGPFLVYIPAGIILIIGGDIFKGIMIIAIGTLVISQIDNVIRPLLFSGKTRTHTLMLFFSIMGGLSLFGLLGIVMGPFIAAVFLTLLRMFELQLHPESTAIQQRFNLSESILPTRENIKRRVMEQKIRKPDDAEDPETNDEDTETPEPTEKKSDSED